MSSFYFWSPSFARKIRKTNIKAKIVDFYKLEDWLTPEQKEKLEKQVLDDKKEKFKRYKKTCSSKS
jgi:hypothetical protein